LKAGGIETILQLMVTLVLRWRKLKENVPTCSNLTAQFASHRDAAAPAALAYGEEPMRARRESQVLFGAAGPRAFKEFIFRKGVSTPDAPADTTASDAALDWLARKARENPAQLINGKPYHIPHTREVFRKLLAEIYDPPRLADLTHAPEPTPGMSDLNQRFCFRTKGNSIDFESNAYKATVVVSIGDKGSIVTLDLDEFVLSDKVAAHADMVDKLLTGTPTTSFTEAQLKDCVARDAKRYALLHPAVPLRLCVYFQPLLMRDNCKRYFQVEMDPDGEGVLPIETVRAGDPYWRVNPETGGLEGCFFAFICDIPDPNGDLRAETLVFFGNVDAFAACRAVEPQTPSSPGQTRAGLRVPMGTIPPKLTANIDIWRRHWVRLDECRVVNFFFNPKNRYRPRKLQPREFSPGIWQTPGHYNISPRQVVGPYSEFAAILTNEPLPIHPQGTRVWTALDRAGNTDLVVSQPLRHWALFKRPHNELLPRGLQLVKEEEPPAGIILYAMTVYDETHPDAFKTGQLGGGTGGGHDGDGDDKKRKGKSPPTPSRDTSHTAKTETTTPSKPSGFKRKAPEGRAEDTSGPRTSQRPKPATPVLKQQEKVGTTASAIIPGVDAEGSAPRGEWHSALQAAISGSGSNFLRLQQLIGQLQTALSPGQPAQGLSVLDFLKLQSIVAEWVDQRQPNSSRRPTTSSSSCVVRSFFPRPFG
jgi:hypothetical protein